MEMISFPFLLSDGATVVRLYAPPKISVNDARRLKRMISALYINGMHPSPKDK